MKKKVSAIIPARMASSRFPGKPLVEILGLPMIEHVRRRAIDMGIFDEVIVATCDTEIRDLVEGHGGQVRMTSIKHERAADRTEEAVQELDTDVVVMIQGDEPTVRKEPLEALIQPFFDTNFSEPPGCTCIVFPIKDQSELTNQNIVKTVLSKSGRMLYLSRSAIPGYPTNPKLTYYKQSGLMAFSKEWIHMFAELESTPLEKQESIDMLRYLEHDRWIQGVVSESESIGVDLESQVSVIEQLIKSDPEQLDIHERITQ